MKSNNKKTPAEIQEIVDEALDAMYAAGENPTIRSLIERVGTDVISSTSTASKYKRNYDERRQAKEQQLFEKIGFSQGFTQAFVKEINRFNVEAEKQYQKAIEALHSDNQELLKALEQTEKLLESERALSSQKIDEVNALKNAIESQKRDFAYTLSDKEKNFEHHMALTKKELNIKLEYLSSENAKLSDRLKKCQSSLESLKNELVQAKYEAEQLMDIGSRYDALSDENKALMQELSEHKKNFSAVEKDAEFYKMKVDAMKETHEKELALKEREIEMLQNVIFKLEKMTEH